MSSPPAHSGQELLEVAELTRTFTLPRTSLFRRAPAVAAVRDVDLSVGHGERFGIVGESGSGKSTLARLLLALDRPQSGSIRYAGREITRLRERQLRFLRRSAQIVLQDPMGSLDPRMRVRDIIMEPVVGLGLQQESGTSAEQLLDAVGLPSDARNRYAHQFSGGERQRIAIARALSPGPELLICDEAVSALDVSVRAQILNLLQSLVRARDLTLIFISHDLSVVRYMTDRVAVMHQGSVVEMGGTERVYSAPGHHYTRELLASIPRMREQPAGVADSGLAPHAATPQGAQVTPERTTQGPED